jgi:hypothetical protein
MYRLIYTTKSILHTCWLSPYLKPLVVLAVAVLDSVHQLEVGHVNVDQAVDDSLLGELQAGVPVRVWNNKIA